MSYKYQETKGNDSEINNIEGGGLNDQQTLDYDVVTDLKDNLNIKEKQL